ncbi:putative glycine-rich cell wall structural protein 1.8-like [Homarus americanus]|uniref:Putative glycine-rich cell wall structural protein 1.8-like n=1 Tax=Homarus americanus TaxID=6706 RepID=A0A8J5N537_HOMAM|nr:putative glycine-rich cell wall structural protein 1.8-like [Homarus americanus]
MFDLVSPTVAVVLGVSSAARVRRGGSHGGGYGGSYGSGYTGGSGGGSGGVNVLLAGNGGSGYFSAGPRSHVLNAGGFPFEPSTYGAQQQWYYHAALAAGDPYAAKAIGGGNYAIQSADAAAASAAHGVVAQANDPNIANAVNYLTDHANSASLNAAAHHGAAYVALKASYNH